MIVKVLDVEKLMIQIGANGTGETFMKSYKVVAIGKFKRSWKYLIDISNFLAWYDMDLFDVIDENIPEDWIEIKYKKFYQHRNRKFNFSLPMRYYCGPSIFIKDLDFLFNIYEEPALAYKVYKDYMKFQGGIEVKRGRYPSKNWEWTEGTYLGDVIPTQEVAIQIAKSIYNYISISGDSNKYKITEIFFDETDEIWIISFWEESKTFPHGDNCNIALRKKDGKAVRIWFGE